MADCACVETVEEKIMEDNTDNKSVNINITEDETFRTRTIEDNAEILHVSGEVDNYALHAFSKPMSKVSFALSVVRRPSLT